MPWLKLPHYGAEGDEGMSGSWQRGMGQRVGIPFINNGQQEKGIRVVGCLVGIFARNVKKREEIN